MARNEKGSGVSELASQLLLNKSNVHRLLQALVHQGFARKNPDTGRYELTMKLWELGARIADRLDVRTEALPFMRELAQESLETVHLSILEGSEVLYIEKIDSPQPVRAYTTVGGRAPAQCVATGKALLAWAGEPALAAVKSRLKPHTGKSLMRLGDLRRELEAIRAQGFAINRGEWREQVVGAAAPSAMPRPASWPPWASPVRPSAWINRNWSRRASACARSPIRSRVAWAIAAPSWSRERRGSGP